MPQFTVFMDVETTGIHPGKDKIVQLSAIKYLGRQEIDRLNTYVNPGCPIPSDATAINGITDDMVREAPQIDEIKDVFLNFIKDTIIVGYNITFDLNFICEALNCGLDGIKYIDVMYLAKKHLELPDYRLETVVQSLGFCPENGFHNSLVDCEATADVFWKLCVQDLAENFPAFKSTKVKKKKGFETFHPKEVVPLAEPSDLNHPLYGKRIVFTGDLSFSRREAAQMAVNVGAIVKTSVSTKTDYLVVGKQDITLVGDDGMSGKEEKAYELNALGKASIRIINESEFISLVEGVALHG